MPLKGLPGWLSGKRICLQCRRCGFNPWVRKIPWSRKWQPAPVFLPRKFLRERSLALWPCKKSNTKEQVSMHTYTSYYNKKGILDINFFLLCTLLFFVSASLHTIVTLSSMRFKESESESHLVVSDSLRLHRLSPWNSPGQNTGMGSLSLLRGSSQPRDGTQVSHIAGNSLPAEPPWKPKNTGVGSLSLLQRIFLTQEWNRGLLHCRQILYQLSHKGSPS